MCPRVQRPRTPTCDDPRGRVFRLCQKRMRLDVAKLRAAAALVDVTMIEGSRVATMSRALSTAQASRARVLFGNDARALSDDGSAAADALGMRAPSKVALSRGRAHSRRRGAIVAAVAPSRIPSQSARGQRQRNGSDRSVSRRFPKRAAAERRGARSGLFATSSHSDVWCCVGHPATWGGATILFVCGFLRTFRVSSGCVWSRCICVAQRTIARGLPRAS